MFALPPIDAGVELVVSSRGMSKGIRQSDEPQVIPKAYVQIGGVQIGGQWKNVTSSTADGEAAAFFSASRKFGSLSVTVGAAYKFQTAAKGGTDTNSLEFTSAVSQKVGRLSVKVGATYSPDDLGRAKRSLYVEGGPAFDLTKTMKLSAGIGRRSRENGPNYLSMNAGATKTFFRSFAVDFRYYRTSRSELGDVYRQRIVIAGRWSF